MKLVVVESPAKAKTIERYLGEGYTVKASMGHIVDLPKSELAVDTEKNFRVNYVVTNSKSLKALKSAFKGKKELILAVDPDREGEAIGWHVAQRLGVINPQGKIKQGFNLIRIVFTSITKEAVEKAISEPRTISMDLVNAQQARRVLDRLVGYKLSPLLWKKIRFGLSAGRVQSVAVRLVVEREEEREKFKPEEYWTITAYLSQKETKAKPKVDFLMSDSKKKEDKLIDTIPFELSKINGQKPTVKSKEETNRIIKAVSDKEWRILNTASKITNRYPKPPFTTSTLQQTASNWFQWNAKKTMLIAQKLYEAGHITYMRTDSTNMAPKAISQIRAQIEKDFGKDFLPVKPIFYKTKSKVAQEAHEAIRCAHASLLPEKSNLLGDDLRLYKLIWQRAVASQMQPARIESSTLEIKIGDHLFVSNGQRMIFKGYLAVYPEKFGENILPKLSIGMLLYLKQINGNQNFTAPPARYSEATLIKALESYGIGRPSTYVPIISTIQARGYVQKLGKYFIPTDTGRIVTKLLKEHFQNIVDYKFTARMEDDLDEIANGKKDWIDVMKHFYTPFEKEIGKKDKQIERETYTVIEDAPAKIKCPECGSRMKIKLGRYGRFYSCSKWPECKGILAYEEEGAKKELDPKSNEFKDKYEGAPKTDDGRDYALKIGRFGRFWAHPDYPKVKDAAPLLLKEKCPKCKKNLVERKGFRGRTFIGCSGYPKCKYIKHVKTRNREQESKDKGDSNRQD